MTGPSCAPNGLLPRLCRACSMYHPGELSWFGEGGPEGSMSGRLARQRGADTEVRVTKVSPSLRMLNPRVLQHRCAPVQSPGTERSKSALRQSITYVKFIEKFRLTLSHEGTTHCDLSKLRARHTKRHMNVGNAKKGPHSLQLRQVTITRPNQMHRYWSRHVLTISAGRKGHHLTNKNVKVPPCSPL